MIKVVDPASFNFDQPITSLVEVHRRGVDSGWMKKTAAVLTKEMAELRPEPGRTFVHLIALGDMEFFGGNRNGDGFPKEANQKYHDTFVKFANFYRNHKNKPEKGHTIYGNVKHSAYNPEMHRVELIISIDNKKAPDTVEKVASGKDLPVSMACRVSEDICSICNHASKTTAEYCDHLKKMATAILEDGRQVCMINRDPTFFDISEVVRNADRIAFSLRKVASVGCVFSADLATEMGVTAPMSVYDLRFQKKLGLLQKAAALEQELHALVGQDANLRSIAACLNVPLGVSKQGATDVQLKPVLGVLKKASVSLPIEDFYRLILGEKYAQVEPHLPAARAALPTIYGSLEKNAEQIFSRIDAFFPIDNFETSGIKDIVKTALAVGSLNDDALSRRMTSLTLTKQAGFVPYEKAASTTDAGRYLACEYACYKLAFLDNQNPFVMRMSLLQNQ